MYSLVVWHLDGLKKHGQRTVSESESQMLPDASSSAVYFEMSVYENL